MTPEEVLSAEIDILVSIWKEGRLARIFCWVQYRWLKYRNTPFGFRWVDDEGESVGEPIAVYHMTLYDMMDHQARGIMTGKVLLEGLRVNAIQVLSVERIDDMTSKTMIQPRWVTD